MTIRTKLLFNLGVVLTVVAALAATGIIGMGLVKSTLYHLTEQSTPFQTRSMEFQRAMQSAITDLVKVNASKSREEYKAYRAEAEKSLTEVKNTQELLEALSGGTKIEAYSELQKIVSKLFEVTEKRIRAEEEAAAADKMISQKLKETSARLKELDGRIKALQSGSQSALMSSMEDSKGISKKLSNVELLRTMLKDLQIAFLGLQNAQGKRDLALTRGRVNSAMSKLTQSGSLKEVKLQDAVKTLGEKVEELVKSKTALIGQTNADTKDYDSAAKEVQDRLAVILASVDQEVVSANEKTSSEMEKQNNIFSLSGEANNSLASNAELTALGLNIEGLSARLFTVVSDKEAGGLESEIRKAFERVNKVRAALERSLAKVEAKEAAKILRNAEGALGSIKGLLLAKDGVVEKVRNRLVMQAEAAQETGNLRKIVLKQAEKSKETLTAARGDQEKAIETVNNTVRFSIVLFAVIGISAVIIAVAFGGWIYGSIRKPLDKLISVAKDVAGGNLASQIDKGSDDEIGELSKSIDTMLHSFRNTINDILHSSKEVVSTVNILNTNAQKTAEGAKNQAGQAGQIAAASEEMTQTITDIAKSASEAAATSAEAMSSAEQGKKVADEAVESVNRVFDSTVELAAMIEKLNVRAGEIGTIVTVIKAIADQTNLLALNAAIEAARAGEQGRGFAVVADEVRKLAEKTIQATTEISDKIGAVQAESEHTSKSMGEASGEVTRATEFIKQVGEALNLIVDAAQKAKDQIVHIATAVNEQSSTAEEVTRNAEQTSVIANAMDKMSQDVMREVRNLSNIAEELKKSTAGFTV
jgi:methyl-accepting chemotaxis protein